MAETPATGEVSAQELNRRQFLVRVGGATATLTVAGAVVSLLANNSNGPTGEALEGGTASTPDNQSASANPTPSGTVVVTNDVVLPRAIDDGINCGMRSIATSVPARELTPAVIDRLFGRLLEGVPLDEHEKPFLGEADCEELLVHGLKKIVEPLGLPPDELLRTESGGTFDLGLDREAIRAALPRSPIENCRGSIGKRRGPPGSR